MTPTQYIAVLVAVVGVLVIVIVNAWGPVGRLFRSKQPDPLCCDNLSEVALALLACDHPEHGTECQTVGKVLWDLIPKLHAGHDHE